VIDVELAAYIDRVRHAGRLVTVARRGHDRDVLHGLQRRLKAAGKRGVPQGGVVSPRLSPLDLTEVEAMRARAQAVTANGPPTDVEDARDADALGLLGHHDRRQAWLGEAINRRRREARAALDVPLHEAKSRIVARRRGERCGGWGVDGRRLRSRRGRWRPPDTPPQQTRTAGLRALKEGFRRARSQPVEALIAEIHPQLRGWVHDLRMGHASRGCAMVRRGVARPVRRHVMRARNRRGFGGKRGSPVWLDHPRGWCAADRVRCLSRACTCSQPRGRITPDAKPPGQPGAGNRHAGGEGAGAGHG
jgi:RNA-directed DNA polymerase